MAAARHGSSPTRRATSATRGCSAHTPKTVMHYRRRSDAQAQERGQARQHGAVRLHIGRRLCFLRCHARHLSRVQGRPQEEGVLSLSDAQSDVAGDYLLLTAPFDSGEEDLSSLKRHGKHVSSGQEQATTLAIVTSPALRAEFGDLRAIAGGQPIDFYDHEGKWTMVVDGLVTNSVVVLMNEAKAAPTLGDVTKQLPRKAILKVVLSHPSEYTTSPPGCLEALAGITTVVPVLSGYHFLPEVETACNKAGVRVMKTTHGSDYSHSV